MKKYTITNFSLSSSVIFHRNQNDKEDQVTINVKPTIGYPSDKIIEYANKETIDIIMGTSDWDLQKSRH